MNSPIDLEKARADRTQQRAFASRIEERTRKGALLCLEGHSLGYLYADKTLKGALDVAEATLRKDEIFDGAIGNDGMTSLACAEAEFDTLTAARAAAGASYLSTVLDYAPILGVASEKVTQDSKAAITIGLGRTNRQIDSASAYSRRERILSRVRVLALEVAVALGQDASLERAEEEIRRIVDHAARL